MEITNMLLEDLPPMRSKRAAVAIMRAQPPTIGHYALVEGVKKFIRNNKELNLVQSPIIVLIGGSKSDKDKKKNPLSLEDRKLFMEASGYCNGCIFTTAPNAFAALAGVRELGYEPIAIAAGSDRSKGYEGILDKYFKDENDQNIEHHIVNLDRDEDAVNAASDGAMDDELTDEVKLSRVSGSLARRAVELGYHEEFQRMVGLKSELAEKLFNKVKAGMEE